MKKYLLAIGFFALSTSGFAQQDVQRKAVITEIFTGTWCQFCPGSAMGADDMQHAGLNVGVLEHHIGDSYEIAATTARDNYYNVGGYPTSVFDGTDEFSGGSQTQSLIGSYLPMYTNSYNTLTPIDIDMTVTDQDSGMFDVSIIATQVGTYSAGNLVVHLAVTESHIPAIWFGLTEINFVTRAMYPSASGTPITLSLNNSDTVNISFTAASGWDLNKSQLVGFIQNTSSKQIYNADFFSLAPSPISLDAELNDFVEEINSTQCGTTANPTIRVSNKGNTDITSLDMSIDVNGNVTTHNWNGNIRYGKSEEVVIPGVTYTPMLTGNTMDVSITMVNGTSDSIATNNDVSATWGNPKYTTGDYTLTLNPDDYGSEITWEFLDGNGAVLLSGGPYSDNDRSQKTATVNIPANGCFSFVIYDSYGDGLSWSPAGDYKVENWKGEIIAQSPPGANYGGEDRTNWEADAALSVSELNSDVAINIHPNPTNGLVNVNLSKRLPNTTLEVIANDGKVVFSKNVLGQYNVVDLSEFAAGVYTVRVMNTEFISTSRVNKF